VGGGVWQCERWAPSMRVTRLPGLFRNGGELKYVRQRLRPLFDDEFKKAGMVNLGETTIGPSMIFLREPVHTFEELRKVKLWSLQDDVTKQKLLEALGLSLVPSSFDKSREDFDQHRVDGFLAPPAGALAFQWSTQARYLLEVVTDDILGCIAVTASAFDKLPVEQRQIILAAVAKFLMRFDDVSAHADQELLGGLFERQGLRILRPDEKFQADFDKASHEAWRTVGAQMVSPQLLDQVLKFLDEYRAQPH
jgi:TRAP-type C4-dicarboxylate transport system substrate-binding protein